MKFRLECVGEQFCQLYFGFDASEVNAMFIKYNEDGSLEEVTTDKIIETIEDVIDDKFNELDVTLVGPRKTSIITRVEKGKPLLGITKSCILPDDINISLPTFIPEELYEFKVEESSIDNFVHNVLIENNLYDLKDIKIVDDDCVVTYDLRYVKDDLIINEIKDQTTDVDDEDDIDLDKFMGKRINNEIVIDKDEVDTIAKITRIQKKVPYELTNEVVSKLKIGSKTPKGFIEKVRNVLEFQKDIQIAMYFIIESISKSEQIKFDDVVVNFLLDSFPETNECDKDLVINSSKKMLICEYLVKVVELKTGSEGIISEALQKKIDESSRLFFLADGRRSQSFLRTLFEDQIDQIKVLEYCKEAGLISNIKL